MADQEQFQGLVRRGEITYFPVVPGRIEFAIRLRRFFLKERPQVVAVELPSTLESAYEKAIAFLPKMSVILVPGADDDEEAASYIPVEPGDPFVEALRTAGEIGSEVVFLEPPTQDRPHLSHAYADPYAVEVLGLDRYIEAYRVHSPPRTAPVGAHAAAMAWKLQGANLFAKVCVVVSLNLLDPLLDAMEAPQEEPPNPPMRQFRGVELFNLHPECLAEVTSEPPHYQEQYESMRLKSEWTEMWRPQCQMSLLRQAEKEYEINTGERIQSWQRLMMARFGRNLAMVDQQLLPGLYDLAVSARSVVDDNFAYEVWTMANRYGPQQSEEPDMETLRITGNQVWLRTRSIRIRRRLPRMKQMLKPRAVQQRKRERKPGEWAQQTKGTSICSYPPEDLAIENYGKAIKRNARTKVSEELSRVEPFKASILDGIDLRETIRNWYRGEIFVKELGNWSGDIGALVVIFDEDREDRYRYLTTWLGEHQNESDMAFYSTEPFEHIVGPGIGRAEYGGFLMTLPPRRLFDIWSDSDYDLARTKAERLLLAAIDYSVDRNIVYVAAKPPRTQLRHIAARLNRKITYLPIGQLSPSKLSKIRVVHVLDSYQRRREAKQYIW